jgi:hypothetical protein
VYAFRLNKHGFSTTYGAVSAKKTSKKVANRLQNNQFGVLENLSDVENLQKFEISLFQKNLMAVRERRSCRNNF